MRLAWTLAACALAARPAAGQGTPPRAPPSTVDHEVPAAERTPYGHHFRVYLPAGYAAEPERRWPLVVYLHGRGEWGDDLDRVEIHGLPAALRDGAALDAIVVAPQSPEGRPWHPLWVEDVVRRVEQAYRVDPLRVALTGISMGAMGGWTALMADPERYAAFAPVAGGALNAQVTEVMSLPPPPEDELRDALRPARAVPVWAFHGEIDHIVELRVAEVTVRAFQAAGGAARLTVYPRTDHDAWTPAYSDPELLAWLTAHRRPAARAAVHPPAPRACVGRYAIASGEVVAETRLEGARLLFHGPDMPEGAWSELVDLGGGRLLAEGLFLCSEDGATFRFSGLAPARRR